MTKFLKFVWSLIRSNLVLKIMAILFAIILWSNVLVVEDPPRQRTMKDISVGYQNIDELHGLGLDISGILSEVIQTVDVRLEVNHKNIKYVTEENVSAYIDLSVIKATGEKTLTIRAETQYGKVLEVTPSQITLFIDYQIEKTVPVNVDLQGAVPEGYYASEPIIAPNVVRISGAKVDVDQVASAECAIDLNGLTQGYNKSIDVTLLDTNGDKISEDLFTDSLSVMVKLDVLARKSVPVDVQSAILGQDDIAPGYEITQIWSEPGNVDIAGEESILETVRVMDLVPYSISGAKGDIVVLLDYLPDPGISVLRTEKEQVYISIREITEVKKYSDVAIVQKNITKGLDAKISEKTVDVTVIAGISKLSMLSKADIVPYVDLEGLEPGVYTLDVLFEFPEGLTVDNFTSSLETVTVTVR